VEPERAFLTRGHAMRVFESIKWFVAIPFYPAVGAADKPGLAYNYLKSLANRFVLKRPPSNKRLSVSFGSEPLYFRDNWFDPRSLYTAFSNDYTALDKNMFNGMKTFVDVGANIGLVSRCARRASPGCAIFCFEPLAENAALCKLNNPDATVEVSAVGSKSGKTGLLVDSSGFMASSLRFGYGQEEKKVPVVSLDDYFSGKKGTIDLLKIDVEGMEMEVIRGASGLLPRTRAVVAEIHSDALLAQFRAFFKQLGFREERVARVERETYIILLRNPAFGAPAESL
jgi:FkbM family methyltransferase